MIFKEKTFKSVDIHQAKKMIAVGNVIIVDIRDPKSFDGGHLANAILLNKSNLQDFMEKTDKASTILCYCYQGISSQDACRLLSKKGFKNLYNIAGGFDAWRTVYPYHHGSQSLAD